MVTFQDHIRYSDAYATGQKQRKIMDEVMKIPDVEREWSSLDFEEIVNKLLV